MVNRRACTTTQRKLGKVRKARAVVMALLVVVALAIVLIDKKEENAAIELAQTEQQSPERTSIATVSDSIYQTVVPSVTSIPQNVDSSNVNSPRISPENVQPAICSPVRTIATSEKPSESRARLIEAPKGAFESQENPGLHCVSNGETLSTIAKKYYGSTSLWEVLYQANRDSLRSPKALKIGQKLKIPAPESVAERRMRKAKGVQAKTRTAIASNYVATGSGDAVLVSTQQGGKYHVVSAGETLSGIAKRERVSLLTLYDTNKDALHHNPNYLREGMRIWIPAAH